MCTIKSKYLNIYLVIQYTVCVSSLQIKTQSINKMDHFALYLHLNIEMYTLITQYTDVHCFNVIK